MNNILIRLCSIKIYLYCYEVSDLESCPCPNGFTLGSKGSKLQSLSICTPPASSSRARSKLRILVECCNLTGKCSQQSLGLFGSGLQFATPPQQPQQTTGCLVHAPITLFCMHFSVASVAELLLATVCGVHSVVVASGSCQPNNPFFIGYHCLQSI